MKIELKVCCPFVWEYDLVKLNRDQSKEILFGNFISPLISSVHCLEKRTNYLKQQFLELEEEYKKRLTPLEKDVYKSNFIDKQYVWEQFLPKIPPTANKNEKIKIENMQFSEATKYFLTQTTKEFLGFNI